MSKNRAFNRWDMGSSKDFNSVPGKSNPTGSLCWLCEDGVAMPMPESDPSYWGALGSTCCADFDVMLGGGRKETEARQFDNLCLKLSGHSTSWLPWAETWVELPVPSPPPRRDGS